MNLIDNIYTFVFTVQNNIAMTPKYLFLSTFFLLSTQVFFSQTKEEINSTFAELDFSVGMKFVEINDYESAIENFKKVILWDSLYSEAYFNIGLCESKLDHNESAIEA